MCHHDHLKLALAVMCKFPIHTKLYILPTLLASWSAPRAQTVGRPLELAHPSPSLSRSGCGRNMLQLLSTHRPYFPSQWKKHCGKMWLLLESCLGIEAKYGEQGICAAPAAPGSWKVSQCLAVQHMQGNFVQAAWHRAHMQLKGKCQFLFLLARTKTNTQLWYFWSKTIRRKLLSALNHYWKSLTCWFLEFPSELSLSHTHAGIIPTWK